VIRLGRAVSSIAYGQETYAPYHIGMYREMRDTELYRARYVEDDASRCVMIRGALNYHRAMMRCIRSARRDQLARGGI